MVRSSGRYFLGFALCCSMGAPWLVLQSVAWANMLVDSSQRYSLQQAIAQTFSGDHPCDLCKRISSRTTNDANQHSQFVSHPDLICATMGLVLVPVKLMFHYPTAPTIPITRADSPPSPPPR